jgi:hypothetical protein
VDWSIFARWEWLLLELFVLALAIFELISVRRSLRRDREAKAVRDSVAASSPSTSKTI